MEVAGGKGAFEDQVVLLTRRQRIKYRLLDKPGLGLLYFCVSYFFELGFLDGAAGFHFARLKCRYFNMIRARIMTAAQRSR